MIPLVVVTDDDRIVVSIEGYETQTYDLDGAESLGRMIRFQQSRLGTLPGVKPEEMAAFDLRVWGAIIRLRARRRARQEQTIRERMATLADRLDHLKALKGGKEPT